MNARQLLFLDPRAIRPDPANVRQDDDELESLVTSLRTYGVLQPLGVVREGDSYRVVYGNRRRAAAILAGLPSVPCVELQGLAETDRLVPQVIENVQRRDLTDLEKAQAFSRLRRLVAEGSLSPSGNDGGQTAKASQPSEDEIDGVVAEMVGLTVRTVRRYLALLDLAPGVLRLLQERSLSITQAQHLRAVANPIHQEELALQAVEQGLTARQIERAVRILTRRTDVTPADAVRLAASDDVVLEESRKPAAVQRLPQRPRVEEREDDDEEAASEPFDDGREPATADGHRVFRIRTMDAFCDVVARLARSLQDGDLQRALQRDPDGMTKLRLSARQLAFVLEEVRRLMG